MKELRDRVAVVTGAASGIGRALAQRFAAEGMKIVLADVERAALEDAERTLRQQGATVVAAVTDVSREADVAALADAAYSAFGAVHVLCNNAGVGCGGLVWEMTLPEWEWVVGVNFWGVLHGIRAFVPRMLSQGAEGHIVNTASIAGLTSSPILGAYQVTKHAVVTLSETLQQDLQIVGSALRVSVLCPGFVKTRVADADRNRPPAAVREHAPSPIDEAASAAIRTLVAGGIPPAAVAEEVVAAIRGDRFCILTHPRLAEAVRRRTELLLSGDAPTYDPRILGME